MSAIDDFSFYDVVTADQHDKQRISGTHRMSFALTEKVIKHFF